MLPPSQAAAVSVSEQAGVGHSVLLASLMTWSSIHPAQNLPFAPLCIAVVHTLCSGMLVRSADSCNGYMTRASLRLNGRIARGPVWICQFSREGWFCALESVPDEDFLGKRRLWRAISDRFVLAAFFSDFFYQRVLFYFFGFIFFHSFLGPTINHVARPTHYLVFHNIGRGRYNCAADLVARASSVQVSFSANYSAGPPAALVPLCVCHLAAHGYCANG